MSRAVAKTFIVLSLGAFLYGCNAGNKASSEHPATKAENVLNRGNGAEPETLDPNKIQDVPSYNISVDLFEGLTVEAPDNTIAPGIAESWDVSADGKTYTFHLRQNAKWS